MQYSSRLYGIYHEVYFLSFLLTALYSVEMLKWNLVCHFNITDRKKTGMKPH